MLKTHNVRQTHTSILETHNVKQKNKIIGGQTNTHNVGNRHKTQNRSSGEDVKKSIEKEIQEPTENVKDC